MCQIRQAATGRARAYRQPALAGRPRPRFVTVGPFSMGAAPSARRPGWRAGTAPRERLYSVSQASVLPFDSLLLCCGAGDRLTAPGGVEGTLGLTWRKRSEIQIRRRGGSGVEASRPAHHVRDWRSNYLRSRTPPGRRAAPARGACRAATGAMRDVLLWLVRASSGPGPCTAAATRATVSSSRRRAFVGCRW